MSPLAVWWQHQRVGTISLGGLGRMEFRYAAEWLEHQAAFPISVSLPLQTEAYGEPAHGFFANILPEADVRNRLCRRLVTVHTLIQIPGGQVQAEKWTSPQSCAQAG